MAGYGPNPRGAAPGPSPNRGRCCFSDSARSFSTRSFSAAILATDVERIAAEKERVEKERAESEKQQRPLFGEGPGAAPRGFGPYPAIKQLQDQLKAAPKVGVRQRLSWGERKADAWAQGKDAFSRATAFSANVTQAIKEIARGITTVTDLERRVGEYDWAIQQSAGMSKAMK